MQPKINPTCLPKIGAERREVSNVGGGGGTTGPSSAVARNPGKAARITESIKTACNFDRLPLSRTHGRRGKGGKEREDKQSSTCRGLSFSAPS